MSTYTTTVIKTGNSYALRVPKQYIEDAQLKAGDKTAINLPVKSSLHDPRKLQETLAKLQTVSRGGQGLANIPDPVAWQRELRQDRTLPGRDG